MPPRTAAGLKKVGPEHWEFPLTFKSPSAQCLPALQCTDLAIVFPSLYTQIVAELDL